jgi:RimJ/RimL family protein N-acetyltransferase
MRNGQYILVPYVPYTLKKEVMEQVLSDLRDACKWVLGYDDKEKFMEYLNNPNNLVSFLFDAEAKRFGGFAWLQDYHYGGRAMIHFAMSKDYFGDGTKIFSEMFLDYVKENLKINLVWSVIAEHNKLIQKLAFNKGFIVSGTIPNYYGEGKNGIVLYRKM